MPKSTNPPNNRRMKRFENDVSAIAIIIKPLVLALPGISKFNQRIASPTANGFQEPR
jgi:hypothetical protein